MRPTVAEALAYAIALVVTAFPHGQEKPHHLAVGMEAIIERHHTEKPLPIRLHGQSVYYEPDF